MTDGLGREPYRFQIAGCTQIERAVFLRNASELVIVVHHAEVMGFAVLAIITAVRHQGLPEHPRENTPDISAEYRISSA